MSRKSNMVLKSANFRKHVKICLVFLTLISILNLTALSLTLFFQFKKPKSLTADEIFKNNTNSIVELKAYSENAYQVAKDACNGLLPIYDPAHIYVPGTSTLKTGIFFEHWHPASHNEHCLFKTPYINL